MTIYVHRFLVAWACAVAIASGTRAVAVAQTLSAAERFTAFAVNMSSVGRPGANLVDIVVTRWSTETERDRLTDILREKGSDALLAALRDTPRVGYIRTPNTIGYDLHFAWQVPADDGGRRVVLATDRYITWWEAWNWSRSSEYPFTLIELRLDADGEGEGKLSIATRITANQESNVIELEHYANQPVRLLSVRTLRPPTM
jgi:hypothetical protein